MRWGCLFVGVMLALPAHSGCLGDSGPTAPASLSQRVGVLEAHSDAGTQRLALSVANETGLTQAALDALVGIHGVHQRAFMEGQIPAAFDESDYVHLAFREPTPVELPLLRKGETHVIEHVYLLPNGTPEGGNVVLDGPTRGEFTSGYNEEELAALVTETIRHQPEQDRRNGSYTFVWVQGSEHTQPPPEPREACDYLWDHRVEPRRERIEYRADAYDFDPTTVSKLVAFDHFDRTTQCPQTYHLDPNTDAVSAEMGEYGNLTLTTASNGSVRVSDRGWLGAGENLTVTYSEQVYDERADRQRWVNGSFTVEHFGEWPRRGLEPG